MTITNNTPKEETVLKKLRHLMPHRVLSYGEALQRAELQANRLLDLHQVTAPVVPIEIISEQPHVRLAQSYDLPASGWAHWDGTTWVITLNAAEYGLRQRFSAMHEYKHILDHPTRHLIQGDERFELSATKMAESVSDYFAACVLMPKAWVKMAFCSETQSIEQLAHKFQVSPKAMSFRLQQLGLVEPMSRRPPAHTDIAVAQLRRNRPMYFRSRSTSRDRRPVGVLT